MRTTALASLAAIAAFATPLAAQRAVIGTQTAPVTISTTSRVVASYEFLNSPAGASLPRSVTVSDSAGTITAVAELASNNQRVSLDVTVIECDVILQTSTPDGLLTIVLERLNEGGQQRLVSGRWTLGNSEGKLVARGQR
jgi:hypothetical protein